MSGYCSTVPAICPDSAAAIRVAGPAELQDRHVAARQPEMFEGKIGGLVGRGSVTADGDRLAFELFAVRNGGLDDKLERQRVGDAADEHDIGALHGGGGGRRIAVLGDVDRAAHYRMREGRAAFDENRRDVEPEFLEHAMPGRVLQRRAGHREAVERDPHLDRRRLLVGGRCSTADGGDQKNKDGETFHHRAFRGRWWRRGYHTRNRADTTRLGMSTTSSLPPNAFNSQSPPRRRSTWTKASFASIMMYCWTVGICW